MENVFKTKSGYCHVLQDKIILNNSINPEIRPASEKNTISWRLIFYSLLSIYLIYKSVNLFRDEDFARFSLYAAAGLVLAYTTIKSLNNTSVGVIERRKIKEVRFNEASSLTRAYFSILFEDPKGNIKKRLIMLPGSLSDGSEEAKKAERIMLVEGYLST